MNPLPRLLATALFVVLAALVALLAAPMWRERTSVATTERSAVDDVTAAPASSRIIALSQRVAFGLALTGTALALGLVFSLTNRTPRSSESRGPFATTRTEVGALAQLAATSAAQGEELNRERDVRRRAEEDAQLKQQLLSQSLEEKIRLGHDLHDGIIQSLYAVGLTLETVRKLMKTDVPEAERRLEQTREGLNSTIRDVRTYITGLTPDNLRRAGFAYAVRAFLSELGAGREAQFDIQIDDDAAALLTATQSLDALQIAREAVSNALRHGDASHINLRMHKSDREVCLLIQDNGRGFDATTRRAGGHGLSNMHARADRIGATLRVTSEPGLGSRVIVTLPVRETAST